MPPRTGVEVPGAGHVLLMGAHAHGAATVTVKLVSLFPGHDPAHQAAIVVFDAATGTPVALMDGDAITAARTAAGSRLATRLLAREDADVLAVVGTGVQGEAHVRARCCASASGPRSGVAGRRPEAARALAAAPRRHRRGVDRGGRARRRRRLRRHPGHRAGAAARVARARRARQLRRLHDARAASSTRRTVRDALVVVESRESALAPPPAGSTDLEGAEVARGARRARRRHAARAAPARTS